MLDLLISLCLIFALFAGLVSSVHELISQALEMRGRVLFEGVASLMGELNDSGRLRRWFGKVERFVKSNGDQATATPLTSLLFAHPLVDSLSQPGSKPSYLDAGCFADTLLNLLQDPKFAAQIDNSPFGTLIAALRTQAGDDAARFKALIETHYDRVMDRVGGWYRRRAKAAMLAISLILAVVLNVDALHVVAHLQNNPKLTADLVEMAGKTEVATQFALSDKPTDATTAQDIEGLRQQVKNLTDELDQFQTLSLPIGWKLRYDHCNLVCEASLLPNQQAPLLGWLLTGLAGTLGAPFWFDLIARLLPMKGKPVSKAALADGKISPANPTTTQTP